MYGKMTTNEGIFLQNVLGEDPKTPLYGVVIIVDNSQE